MPRRSRPSYRLPPNKGDRKNLEGVPSSPNHQYQSQFVDTENDSEDEFSHLSGEDFEQGSSLRSEDGELEDSDDEVGADAPRVAVWEEDDDDFLALPDGQQIKRSDEDKLQDDLRNLPLGALRRAQELLKLAVAESESESDTSLDEDSTEVPILKRKGKERVEWSTKPLADGGRRNKHAPVEMTAKKPVTRKRRVIDVPKIIPRDPRFLPTAGTFDPQKFQQSYEFLTESRKVELHTLRESLTKARKMLASSPRELRSQREEEIEKLERATKRTESMVNRDRTARVEQELLSKTKKEEMERRKQGKGKWFLKKADEKELRVKARYEMLATAGGQRAVKKAIDKRQKKISQKEKRSRPYLSRNLGGEGSEERPAKRLRVL